MDNNRKVTWGAFKKGRQVGVDTTGRQVFRELPKGANLNYYFEVRLTYQRTRRSATLQKPDRSAFHQQATVRLLHKQQHGARLLTKTSAIRPQSPQQLPTEVHEDNGPLPARNQRQVHEKAQH